jgi:hypothetical protein
MKCEDLWTELDTPPLVPKSATPIHVGEEHLEPLIKRPDFIDRLSPRQKKGTLGLIDLFGSIVVEISHSPPVEGFALLEKARKAKKLNNQVTIPRESSTRWLYVAVGISQLWGNDAHVRGLF